MRAMRPKRASDYLFLTESRLMLGQ